MKDKLSNALNEVRDDFIAEAAQPKKRRLWLFPAVAALLAVAVLGGSLMAPWGPPQMGLPGTSSGSPRPNVPVDPQPDPSGDPPPTQNIGGPVDPSPFTHHLISMSNSNMNIPTWAPELAEELKSFFEKSIQATLAKDPGKNKSYSPANLYLALSALTELTEGDPELMALLGAEDLDSLRNLANRLWNAVYRYEEDKDLVVTLANGIWLEEGLQYNQEIMDILASNYYTDSFYGDLGSLEVNLHIIDWLNYCTGNLLREQTKEISLDPETIFAMYSAIYYKVQWTTEFSEALNTPGAFFGTEKSSVTYMNQSKTMGVYFGSNFTAICNPLRNGGMWLILPDEGVAPESLLESQEYLDLVLGLKAQSMEEYVVNLSLPKFDIQTGGSLKEDLQSLGIHNIFSSAADPFGSFIRNEADGNVYISEINQATRVCVDEIGITAVSYVEIQAPSDSVPPEKEVDFILDRPFLYVITNRGDLPLFAGVVNDLS